VKVNNFLRLPSKVQKRDGSFVDFNQQKIQRAISKAAHRVVPDAEQADKITGATLTKVLEEIAKLYKEKIPTVENIQDIVEKVLMQSGHVSIAKKYILYRKERQELRHVKGIYGVKDDLKLPLNALFVLKKRYLLKDDSQNIIESPKELFKRVAKSVSKAEVEFRSDYSKDEVEEQFFRMMANMEFLPNSPTLMNAGTPIGQLSACFVLPVEDSMEGIFDSLKNMACIHQTGGGCGFDFSHLRPKDDLVSTTKGKASGPLSFMNVFNEATKVIIQGGRRRGANMGILRCDHPDTFDFVEAKLEKDSFSNFNLSVGVTDEFMEAAGKNESFYLINPRTQEKVKSIRAKSLFDLIVYAAWRSGDPGLIFLDEINRHNPLPKLGRIEATNPCGEVPLFPYESCNLGSINLSKFVESGDIDWIRLKEAISWAMRFLDDVIEVNKYPLEKIKEMTLANRKIGLGVMGFADMLIKLGIPYKSEKAEQIATKLMRMFHRVSIKASESLAEERGVFPNYEHSVYFEKGLKLRNATVNTIAPTGTISILANCSSGIEPLFALSYVRRVLSGAQLFEVHPLFELELQRKGLDSKEIVANAGRLGSIQEMKEVPEDLRELFVTAFDILPEEHLKIQAAFQKYTDNSVSKTINLPSEATVEEVRKIYFMAHAMRCKGITVYRYGTKKNQVLSFRSKEEGQYGEDRDFIAAEPEFSGGCFSEECFF